MTVKPRPGRSLLLLAVLAVVSLFALACSSSDDDNDSTDESSTTTTEAAASDAPSDADIQALTAEIAGGGASFPDAFYQAVNTDFNGIHGSEIVTYTKSGSTDGRTQLLERHGRLRRLGLAAQGR